jgi:hypothetical protein
MRTQTVFVILLVLLSLSRIGEVCRSASEYVEASGLLSLYQLPRPKAQDRSASAALIERRRSSFQGMVESGLETVMLGGVGVCFFLVLRRRKVPVKLVSE